ncbi:MAG: hypothetical protein M3Y53_08005 [Thermoproteota archaeon]|nr:hypothetical protein [Thermoproteota archaeon]
MDYHSYCNIGIFVYTFGFRFQAITQHISLVVVSAVNFLAARSLGESFKLFARNGIIGLARLMFSVLDKPIYLVYSVKSHNNTGTWMLFMCIVFASNCSSILSSQASALYARTRQVFAPTDYYAILLELSFILPKLMCEVKHKAMLGQSKMV